MYFCIHQHSNSPTIQAYVYVMAPHSTNNNLYINKQKRPTTHISRGGNVLENGVKLDVANTEGGWS